MVTDSQVRRLWKLSKTEQSQEIAAAKAGMDRKTARKYVRSGELPSQMKVAHTWRTREDVFAGAWEEIREELELNSGLESKTLFEALQRKYPGRFQDGQLRTLQRRVKRWRVTEGPGKEVFFAQEHPPGKLSASDFTPLTSLGVTIGGQSFPHLAYHFVLTYSNWEAFTICYSESFESLSEGLQNALWELGGVPAEHRTDRLSSAVNNMSQQEEFTDRYAGLLAPYGLRGQKTQAGRAHENGDVEQRHHRFKRAVDQALMLRGSRDFARLEEYREFLESVVKQLNAGRRARLAEELKVLRELPARRLEEYKRVSARVASGSLIYADRNVYSVNSRLIGEEVEVRLYAERVEVWYGQKKVEQMPRLRGRGKHRVQYRHVIDWLVRKPGAFENYRYREELFPTSRFRMAYDALKEAAPGRASREYLKVLELAAKEGETRVDEALRVLLEKAEESGSRVSAEVVAAMLAGDPVLSAAAEVGVQAVSLVSFDELYGSGVEETIQ